ncbi:hypothetical protein CDD83_11177 [Cordyceps sp. RAO-2017]|nr:hypothetical protein CDD83_11177 [Cordyceps sp. RAO-2017]
MRPIQQSPFGLPKPGNESQPWTAARCLRLLHQLQLRLACLRKLVTDNPPPPSCIAKRPLAADHPPRVSKRIRFTYGRRRRPTLAPESETPTREKTLTAMKTPPPPMRTLRAMKPIESSPVCGLAGLSTTVWRQIHKQTDTPLCTEARPAPIVLSGSPDKDLSDLFTEMRSLCLAVPATRYRVYEAIFSWLDGLLRSTACHAQDPHPHSLLSICLRRFPACIANIEAYEKQKARGQEPQSIYAASNVPCELYEQLENFGSLTHGWRPMTLAVRFHAISLLSEAASDGLLEPEYVRLLTQLCLRLDCKAGASRLAASVQATLPTPCSMLSSMTASSRFLPLSGMLESSKDPMIFSAALQCVSCLIHDNLLPPGWLSTRVFSVLWESSLESIASGKSTSIVAHFALTCLPFLVTGKRANHNHQTENSEKTLTTVVAGLVVAAAAVGKENRRRQRLRRTLYILDRSLAEVRNRKGWQQRQGLCGGQFVLLLARYFMVVDSPFANTTFKRQARDELLELVQDSANAVTTRLYYRQATAFLSRLAQYRSKTHGAPGREMVTELCAKLQNVGLGDCFSCDLQTDVAFLLAQHTRDLRDLAFAESLSTAERYGKASCIFSGWRWEEGISEWVLPERGADGMIARLGPARSVVEKYRTTPTAGPGHVDQSRIRNVRTPHLISITGNTGPKESRDDRRRTGQCSGQSNRAMMPAKGQSRHAVTQIMGIRHKSKRNAASFSSNGRLGRLALTSGG